MHLNKDHKNRIALIFRMTLSYSLYFILVTDCIQCDFTKTMLTLVKTSEQKLLTIQCLLWCLFYIHAIFQVISIIRSWVLESVPVPVSLANTRYLVSGLNFFSYQQCCHANKIGYLVTAASFLTCFSPRKICVRVNISFEKVFRDSQ